MTSNVAIDEKNKKRYVIPQLSIPGTQGTFSPDIDSFTNEPVVE